VPISFVSLRAVLLRVLVESLLATDSAEVVFLSFLLGASCRLALLNLRLANWSNSHWDTSLNYFSNLAGLNLLKRREVDTTVMELAAMAAAARMGFKKP